MESKVNFFFLFLFLFSLSSSIFSVSENIEIIKEPTKKEYNSIQDIKSLKSHSQSNKEEVKSKEKNIKYSVIYHKSKGTIDNTILWLDLLIPSYGLYSLDHKTEGSIYGVLKVATAIGIYFVYQHYNTWNNYYLQNKSLNQPEDTFFWVDGQFLTLQSIQNKADISFLTFTYMILLEVVIYSVSFYRTYNILNAKRNQWKAYYSIFPQISFLYNKYNNTSIQFNWKYHI